MASTDPGSVRRHALSLLSLPESILRCIVHHLDRDCRFRVLPLQTASPVHCSEASSILITTFDSFSYASRRARAIALSTHVIASARIPCDKPDPFLERGGVVAHTFRYLTSLTWWMSPYQTEDDICPRHDVCDHVTTPSIALIKQLHNFCGLRNLRIAIPCSLADEIAASSIMIHIATALAAAQMQPDCPVGLRSKNWILAEYRSGIVEERIAQLAFTWTVLAPLPMFFARQQNSTKKCCITEQCTLVSESSLIHRAERMHRRLMQQIVQNVSDLDTQSAPLSGDQISVQLCSRFEVAAPIMTECLSDKTLTRTNSPAVLCDICG